MMAMVTPLPKRNVRTELSMKEAACGLLNAVSLYHTQRDASQR
jgi:hypothetical protein